MQRSWIAVGVVGVVAVVLAFLLLPSPDTGGDVPARGPGDRGNPVAGQPSPAPGIRPGRPGEPAGEPVLDADGNPIVAAPRPMTAMMERRSQPDAVAAGRASAPWSLVRRQLLAAEQNDETKVLLDESAKMIQILRDTRRDPDSNNFEQLVVQQRELAARVRSNPAGKDPQIVAGLERLDTILDEYIGGPDPARLEKK